METRPCRAPGNSSSACPGPAEQRQHEGTELRRAPVSPELTPNTNRGKGKGRELIMRATEGLRDLRAGNWKYMGEGK